jgi:hypothetical protein
MTRAFLLPSDQADRMLRGAVARGAVGRAELSGAELSLAELSGPEPSPFPWI